MSLRETALRSVSWTATSTGAILVIRLLQTVAVARLVLPADLGLYALVNLILGAAALFADAGLSQGIVSRQDTTDAQLSTLYWANLVVGGLVGMAVLAVAMTPPLGWLYADPRLPHLLALAALLFPVAAVGQPYLALLQKRLEFARLGRLEIASHLSGALATVALAAVGWGVEGLLVGQILFAVVRSTLLVLVGGAIWRPGRHFHLGAVSVYLRFGLFQVADRLIAYFNMRLDQFLIGTLAGTEALGYYNMAWMISVDPVYRLMPVITNVAFPIFARKQDDRQALKRGFLLVITLLATVIAPLLLGIAAIAPGAVPLLLGERWIPAVPLVQLLALIGIARAIASPTGTLILAVGRADIAFAWTVTLGAVQLPLYALVLSQWGLTTASLFLGAFLCATIPLLYLRIIRSILGPMFRDYVAAFLPAVLLAAAMAIAVRSLGGVLGGPSPLTLGAQVLFGMVIYGGATLLTRRGDWQMLRSLARRGA